jgi:hypothetical protein
MLFDHARCRGFITRTSSSGIGYWRGCRHHRDRACAASDRTRRGATYSSTFFHWRAEILQPETLSGTALCRSICSKGIGHQGASRASGSGMALGGNRSRKPGWTSEPEADRARTRSVKCIGRFKSAFVTFPLRDTRHGPGGAHLNWSHRA